MHHGSRAGLIAWLVVTVGLSLVPTAASADAPPTEVVRLTRSFINVYALVGERVVIVDAHNRGNERWVLRRLRRLGIAPDRVSAIVLTHGHADHAGSALALHEATGAPLIGGSLDVPMFEAGDHGSLEDAGLGFRILAAFLPDRYPAFTPDLAVDAPLRLDDYGIAGELRPVGAHSPGSLWIRLDDGQAMVGDLVRSGFVRRHRPRDHYLHVDRNASHVALTAIIEDVHTLHPGHGSALSQERMRAWVERGRP